MIGSYSYFANFTIEHENSPANITTKPLPYYAERQLGMQTVGSPYPVRCLIGDGGQENIEKYIIRNIISTLVKIHKRNLRAYFFFFADRDSRMGISNGHISTSD